LQDSAGAVLTQALVTQWLSEQRRWAWSAHVLPCIPTGRCKKLQRC